MLWAITCYFNPTGYRRRLQNYRAFRERLNVPLVTVEQSFSGQFSLGAGRPTFLNLDKPYPNQVFTVVIWVENRSAFGKPEVDFKDKNICVSDRITSCRGVPQIEARHPSQIKVVKR